MTNGNEKRSMSLAIRILIGLVLGVVVGLALQGSPEIANTFITFMTKSKA
ncbi:MAG: hypothetical protein GX666_10645 [Tissierellia bacterium]|nr:hypothetical protein [Tissierellia bacterium]